MNKEEIITFQEPWNIREQKEPSCFNGGVRVRKIKITIEEVKESDEVINERLEKLWVGSTNWHDMEPLVKEAQKTNYLFKGKFRSIDNNTHKNN